MSKKQTPGEPLGTVRCYSDKTQAECRSSRWGILVRAGEQQRGPENTFWRLVCRTKRMDRWMEVGKSSSALVLNLNSIPNFYPYGNYEHWPQGTRTLHPPGRNLIEPLPKVGWRCQTWTNRWSPSTSIPLQLGWKRKENCFLLSQATTESHFQAKLVMLNTFLKCLISCSIWYHGSKSK